MFRTGIDIDRLGMMFVSGQPKTTSAYIQSTQGREERRGLVVTNLRAGRPGSQSLRVLRILPQRDLQARGARISPTIFSQVGGYGTGTNNSFDAQTGRGDWRSPDTQYMENEA